MPKLRLYISFSFLVLTLTGWLPAMAQDSSNAAPETHMTIEDAKDQHNQTPGEDIDNTITNNYMRAQSGSKSRWSLASQLYYMGGTINNPLGAERPNIAAGAAIPKAAMMQGQVSTKYNISSQHSLMAGTGLDWVTPFQGSYTPADYNRKFDVFNPYVIYQYLYSWSGIQSALQFQPTLFTQTSSVDDGYTFYLQLSQNNVYEVGHTGLSLGLYTVVQEVPYFDKTGMQSLGGKMIDLNSQQADLSFGVDPFIEYQLSDRYNLRTVFNFWNFDHWRANPNSPQDPTTQPILIKEPWTQSVGVGIKVTRDIFLYPNVQFLPEQIRGDLTNVALNTFINVF